MISLAVAENIFFVLMVVFILPCIVCHIGCEAVVKHFGNDNESEGNGFMDFFYIFPGTLIVGPLLTVAWIAGICVLVVKIIHVLEHF